MQLKMAVQYMGLLLLKVIVNNTFTKQCLPGLPVSRLTVIQGQAAVGFHCLHLGVYCNQQGFYLEIKLSRDRFTAQ